MELTGLSIFSLLYKVWIIINAEFRLHSTLNIYSLTEIVFAVECRNSCKFIRISFPSVHSVQPQILLSRNKNINKLLYQTFKGSFTVQISGYLTFLYYLLWLILQFIWRKHSRYFSFRRLHNKSTTLVDLLSRKLYTFNINWIIE